MILVATLALVICFTNFVKLHPCTEHGEQVKGFVFVAYDAIQSMRRTDGCTQLFMNGGGRQFVKETPEELIALQEHRDDKDFGGPMKEERQ